MSKSGASLLGATKNLMPLTGITFSIQRSLNPLLLVREPSLSLSNLYVRWPKMSILRQVYTA